MGRHDELVAIGRGGLRVSQLGLGTAPLGGMFSSVDEDASDQLIETAIHRGIRYFDTAPLYGHTRAERRLGRGLAPHLATEPVISSKVGRILEPGPLVEPTIFVDVDPFEPVFDFSRDGVLRSLESSLERLGVDRIDLVYIHDPDDHADQAIDEAYPTLHQLRSEGVITSIGVGMNQSAVPTRFVEETDIDVVLIAGRYTVLDQSAQHDLLEAALRRDVTIVAAGVFNSGVLMNPTAEGTYNYEPAPEPIITRARDLHTAIGRHDVSVAAVGLQFPLRHPAVKAVLTGARSADELQQNIDAFETEIPQALWEDLEESGLIEPIAPAG